MNIENIEAKTAELRLLTDSINNEWKKQMGTVRERLERIKLTARYDAEWNMMMEAMAKRDMNTLQHYLGCEYDHMNYYVVREGEFYFQ